jgi:hypothetical protein
MEKATPKFQNMSLCGTDPFHGPTRIEFLGLADRWHPLKTAMEQIRPLGQCLARHKERWIPALRAPRSLDLLPHGRACKIRDGRSFAYGKEVSIARLAGPHTKITPNPDSRAIFCRAGRLRYISKVQMKADLGIISSHCLGFKNSSVCAKPRSSPKTNWFAISSLSWNPTGRPEFFTPPRAMARTSWRAFPWKIFP